MDTRTGELVNPEAFNDIPAVDRKFFVPVQRDLSKTEAANMQIKKYSPCACGSGKKFKFCCFKKL